MSGCKNKAPEINVTEGGTAEAIGVYFTHGGERAVAYIQWPGLIPNADDSVGTSG
jgi:hypothetical protein